MRYTPSEISEIEPVQTNTNTERSTYKNSRIVRFRKQLSPLKIMTIPKKNLICAYPQTQYLKSNTVPGSLLFVDTSKLSGCVKSLAKSKTFQILLLKK